MSDGHETANCSFMGITHILEKISRCFLQLNTPHIASTLCTWSHIATTKQTRIDVYETLCPQQMLVYKGGKIKNWGGECRDVTPTKSLSQNIRVDVNREVKFL